MKRRKYFPSLASLSLRMPQPKKKERKRHEKEEFFWLNWWGKNLKGKIYKQFEGLEKKWIVFIKSFKSNFFFSSFSPVAGFKCRNFLTLKSFLSSHAQRMTEFWSYHDCC